MHKILYLLIIIVPAADLLLLVVWSLFTDLGFQLWGNLLMVGRLNRKGTWRMTGNHMTLKSLLIRAKTDYQYLGPGCHWGTASKRRPRYTSLKTNNIMRKFQVFWIPLFLPLEEHFLTSESSQQTVSSLALHTMPFSLARSCWYSSLSLPELSLIFVNLLLSVWKDWHCFPGTHFSSNVIS